MNDPLVPNDTLFLVYSHFDQRVNREAHLLATLDGSVIENNASGSPHSNDPNLLPFHINYFTFGKLFQLLDGKKHLQFVETGTSANAVDSTTLFDAYVKLHDGNLITIDIDPVRAIGSSVRWSSNTKAVTSDSAAYLRDWASHQNSAPIDVLYLDSWDIEWTSPEPSQNHGLVEFNSALPFLSKEAYILIDDTPVSPEWLPFRGPVYEQIKQQVELGGMMPGKGAYVKMIIQNDPRFEVLLHQYQLLIKYTA